MWSRGEGDHLCPSARHLRDGTWVIQIPELWPSESLSFFIRLKDLHPYYSRLSQKTPLQKTPWTLIAHFFSFSLSSTLSLSFRRLQPRQKILLLRKTPDASGYISHLSRICSILCVLDKLFFKKLAIEPKNSARIDLKRFEPNRHDVFRCHIPSAIVEATTMAAAGIPSYLFGPSVRVLWIVSKEWVSPHPPEPATLHLLEKCINRVHVGSGGRDHNRCLVLEFQRRVYGRDSQAWWCCGTVNKECERFKHAELTNDQFKCLIFVCGLQPPSEAPTVMRLLNSFEEEPETNIQKLVEECKIRQNLVKNAKLVGSRYRGILAGYGKRLEGKRISWSNGKETRVLAR